MKTLRDFLAESQTETLEEGWHRHKDGQYTAWGAEVEHHLKDGKVLHCPGCGKSVDMGSFHHHKDREGDITHSTHVHSCGTKLKVFND